MYRVLEFIVALAPVLSAWAAAAALVAVRSGRNDFARSAWRAGVAAAACAGAGVAGLGYAFAVQELGVRYVALTSSIAMPVRYAVGSLLAAPGGALLAFAAVVAALGAAAVGAQARAGSHRLRVLAGVTGIMTPPLAIVAIARNPFAGFAVPTSDGAGLPGDLQAGVAGAHAALLLVGTAAAGISCTETWAALSRGTLDAGWRARTRAWNGVAAAALVAGVVLGVRWHAVTPSLGAWLDAAPSVLWMLALGVTAWLAHLSTGRQDPARVVTSLLLGVAAFAVAGAALAAARGAWLVGTAPVDRGLAGTCIAVMPLAALVVTVRLLRTARGALAVAPAASRRRPAGAWLALGGLALLAAVAVGGRMARVHEVALGDTEIFRARDPFGRQWQFASQGLSTLERDNYALYAVSVLPSRGAARLPIVSAEARSYLLADGREPGEPSRRAAVIRDPVSEVRVWVVAPDARRPTLRVQFAPLGTWAVPAAIAAALGFLLAALPQRASGPPEAA